jgi:hypothetical protein
VLGKDAIEAVEVAFILHERQAREVIELLGRERRDACLERFEQAQELGQRGRDAARSQVGEEPDEHRAA